MRLAGFSFLVLLRDKCGIAISANHFTVHTPNKFQLLPRQVVSKWKFSNENISIENRTIQIVISISIKILVK